MDPLTAAAIAGGIAGPVFDFLGGSADREYQATQTQQQNLQQFIMSRAGDLLGAKVGKRRRGYLEDIPEYQPYEYTAPDEAVFERMRQLGIEDISEAGRQAELLQAERLAGAGLGMSSIGIGAGQRMAQRTARELGRFETDIARQQAEAQLRYEQLMAAEQAKAHAAAVEMAGMFAEYETPTEEEIKETYRTAGESLIGGMGGGSLVGGLFG